MNKKAMTVRGQDSDNSPAEAHLWVCSGKNVGRRYAIGTVPKVLGRAVACDIVVEDERASQRHARLHFTQGKHIVGDLGSTNGTFVNSHRVQEVELQDGDLIQIGETVFEYLFEGASNYSQANEYPSGRGGPQKPNPVPPGELVPIGHPPAMPKDLVPPGYQHPGYGQGPLPPAPYTGHFQGSYYPPEEEEPESSFDLVAYLIWLRKIIAAYRPYWPIVASFMFIGVALGALYHKNTPVPYSASFQIVLRPSGTSRSVLGGGGGSSIKFFDSQVATRFTSVPVIEQALKRVSGKVPTPIAVATTAANLTFERIGNNRSNMYSGSIIAKDGDYTIRYLNTHLRVFLNREVEMALSPVQADVRFFRKQVAETARAVDKAELAVSEYKATHPDALPDLAKTNYNLLFTLQQKRSELERQLVSIDASLREDTLQFEQTPKYSKSSISQTNAFAEQIATTEGELAAARAQGKGNLHPDVIQLTRKLEEYRQLSNARRGSNQSSGSQVSLNPTYLRLQQRVQEGRANHRALKQELRQVKANLESQKRKIELLPKAEAEYRELAQEYETAQTAYSQLLKHLKNAELHLDRERARADSQYNIVVPPRQTTRDPNSGRFGRLLLGGFGGVFLAVLMATVLAMRTGQLSLTLLIGREIDLSAVFGDEESPPPPSPPVPTSNRSSLVPAASSDEDLAADTINLKGVDSYPMSLDKENSTSPAKDSPE